MLASVQPITTFIWSRIIKMTIPKDDFELLNNFAHDLKTPLAAVKSYIELMGVYGELNEKQQHFQDRAQLSLEQMQRIVTGLLNYSQLEQNRSLNLQVVDLYEMVETTVAILESAASEKNISIEIDIPIADSQVFADPLLLEHAITNLLTNAIKYNKHDGRVIVKARTSGATQVRVDISDTGIGIPREEQRRVWERFYRIERQGQSATEGTGLGLAIVKAVIEKHGGHIRLASTEGKGTTFTFDLPRPRGSSQELDREFRDDIDDRHQEERERLEDNSDELPTQQDKPALNKVQFTAYYPREIYPKTRHKLLVYTHEWSQLPIVEKDVRRFVDELGGKVPSPKQSGRQVQLQHHTEVTIIPESDAIEFEPKSITKRWRGDFLRYDFDFFAPSILEGEAALIRISIQVAGIEIAHIKGAFDILSTPEFDQPKSMKEFNQVNITTKPYQNIFISYSRKDLEIISVYKIAQLALGNEVFLDVDSLRAGENWKDALKKAIEKADIFQLFWSEHSLQSTYCKYEWQYALENRCPDTQCNSFIRPVYWQKPMPFPPDELAHLNFKYAPLSDLTLKDIQE
jgi:two-component sensor histidine kinase